MSWIVSSLRLILFCENKNMTQLDPFTGTKLVYMEYFVKRIQTAAISWIELMCKQEMRIITHYRHNYNSVESQQKSIEVIIWLDKSLEAVQKPRDSLMGEGGLSRTSQHNTEFKKGVKLMETCRTLFFEFNMQASKEGTMK